MSSTTSLLENARNFAEGGYSYTGEEVRLWVYKLCDEIERMTYGDAALNVAYAEGRDDERLSTVLACIDIVAMHGGSVEIEAAMRALLDSEHDFKHDAERLLCGAAPVTEGDVIALAVAHNLGRTMKPLGMQTGDVFVTDQSYRTAELLAFAAAVADAERERAALVCDGVALDCENSSGYLRRAGGICAAVSCAVLIRGMPANDVAKRPA